MEPIQSGGLPGVEYREPEGGRINQANGILESAGNRLMGANDRLEALVERLIGAGPSPASTAGPVDVPTGQMGDLAQRVETIARWVDRLHDTISQLEEL